MVVQLKDCISTNRSHQHPFDLHLCNFDANGDTAAHLARAMPTLFNRTCPLDMHKNCFTEIFPKERLVYLTPDCGTDLIEFNPEDIYVIGSISSMHESREMVLAQAKQSGVRMARLPISKFLEWKYGDKAFTPAELVKLLLGLKCSRDWIKAFQFLCSSKFFIK